MSDPRFFNFCMIGLSALASLRWAAAGSAWDVWYWLSAMSITMAVTFR